MLLCDKGHELIGLYKKMYKDGYARSDGTQVANAFSDFELRAYAEKVKEVFDKFEIKTVLDYGGGGSNWYAGGFNGDQSALEYFNLTSAASYDPGCWKCGIAVCDAVICFDTLEHCFVYDIPAVLDDIFSHTKQLVVMNIACYPAAALLPNGENAHVTVRNPGWWAGMVDAVAIKYPEVSVCMLTSMGWRQSIMRPIYKSADWLQGDGYVR